MTSADEIRALAQSIHEATQRLADATGLVVEMLNALQEPTTGPEEPLVGVAPAMPRRCPECKAGKPDNCTVTLEDGNTLCADYRQRTFR